MRTLSDFFSKINGYEIAFDLAVFIFVLFLEGFIGSPLSKKFINDSGLMAVLYLVFAYCMPWYLGGIYMKYKEYKKAWIDKTVLVIFSIIVLFIFIMITFLCVAGSPGGFENRSGFILTSGIVLLIMGCIAALTVPEGKTGSFENTKNISGGTIILVFTIGMLGFFYIAIYKPFLPESAKGFLYYLYFFGTFFGVPVIIAVALMIVMIVKGLLVRLNLTKALFKIKDFALPFFLTTLLLLFNSISSIYITRIGTTIFRDGSSLPVVLLLVFSGILPMRLLLILAPPVRFVNIVTGIAGMAVYIYSIVAG
jgi:hypothetical protein